MPREQETEVLVVGAGPVGMLAALLLAKEGVSVRIIDQESRTASRTYACALHPTTIKLLDGLGLAREIVGSGHKVTSAAFYEGATRRAQARLSELEAAFPFVVVLAQSTLEGLLEEHLKQAAVPVEWTHKLSGLRADPDAMLATIDQLGVSAKGFIVPEMEWSVEKTHQLRARYVVGADGAKSMVAESLGGAHESVGEPEFYAVYEFQSDWAVRDELRVVLDEGTTSVLWPVRDNKFRWSFQLRQEHLNEFPSKDRQSLVIDQPALDQANRAFVQKLLRQRAPWFTGKIDEIGWSTDVEFQHRVVKRFGQGYCWLAGDAAHQTGPAGMQSMNQGLLEASQLTSALAGILRRKADSELLETYDRESRETWSRMLGLRNPLTARPGVDPWIRDHRTRILPCVPASGDHLKRLLSQLQLDLD